MHPDHAAFLRAIIANPDDDLPRLVFADWLEEQGQPALAARAAFIRAQIEAERWPEGSAERAGCEKQASGLTALYGPIWDVLVPEWVCWGDTSIRYRRGFIGEFTTTPRRFLRDSPLLFEVAPVQTVRLMARHTGLLEAWPYFREIVPAFAHIHTIQFGPGLRQTFVERKVAEVTFLITCQSLSGLRRLVLREMALPDSWVVAFAAQFQQAPFAHRLQQLDLSANQITDAGASTLAAARGLDRLERLVLTGNRITDGGASLLRRRFGDRVIL